MNGTNGNDALVGTDWLSERLGDPKMRIVEVVVSPKAYDEGHIPGAVMWNVYADLKDADYRLKEREDLERVLSRSGIDPTTEIVFYGYAPAFGFWLMKLFGHANMHILDASRETWQAEGRPWTDAPTSVVETTYRLPAEDARIRVRRPFVEHVLGDPAYLITDVRTAAEYQGERFWPSGGMEVGGRAGHIPGAVHVPIDGLYDGRGSFRSVGDLHEIYRAVDAAGDRTVIPYCTVGGRATTTWFVLTYLLGRKDVRVYDGSWAEWGRAATTPVDGNLAAASS
jgi:thiosulfate/3-mercaptopyruvate sulfurtransferase